MALLGMEWLGTPADPGGKLAQGFALGSSFIARRQQQEMERERLDMLKDEFAFDQQVMRPLDVQLKKAQIEAQKMSMVSRMMAGQAGADIQGSAELDFAGMAQDFGSLDPRAPDYRLRAIQVFGAHPLAAAKPQGRAMFSQAMGIADTKDALDIAETVEIATRAGTGVDPNKLSNPLYRAQIKGMASRREDETKGAQKSEAERARVTFQTDEAIRLARMKAEGAAKDPSIPEGVKLKVRTNTEMLKNPNFVTRYPDIIKENEALLAPYMPQAKAAPTATAPTSTTADDFVKQALGQ